MVRSKKDGGRSYLARASQVASHPTRRMIVKELRKGKSLSGADLNKKLNVDRYDLYHHLKVLKDNFLIFIDNKLSEGKRKFYKVPELKGNPGIIGFYYDNTDIVENKEIASQIYTSIEKFEKASSNNITIPEKEKIKNIEIVITYEEEEFEDIPF